MYKLSYEKCVCFIFLVIVAILSCSGFRIDSLAVTDISKKNSYTSSNLLESPHTNDFFNRLFLQNIRYNQKMIPPQETLSRERYLTKRNLERRHRIRHFRQLKHHQEQQLQQQQQQHSSEAQGSHFENRPSGRIDTIVIRPSDNSDRTAVVPTIHPSTSEQLAQIPPSDGRRLLPTAAIVTRSQRSSNKNKQRNKPSTCQEQDVARKAYLANTVVLAKAESTSSIIGHNYSVSFKILKRLKNSSSPVDDHIRLTFSSDNKMANCETEGQERSHSLVKAEIQRMKDYFLFLNAYEGHNYSVYGSPLLKKKKNKKDMDEIYRVINRPFEVKPPNITSLNQTITKGKLRLTCKVKGFPIPYISWKKDGAILRSNRARITYRRRKTTLVIKNPQERDYGNYECVARGVDGIIASETITVVDIANSVKKHGTVTANNVKKHGTVTLVDITNSEKKHGTECDDKMKENYCYNGGTCFKTEDFEDYNCVCPDGYSGHQCEKKDVSNQSSMYGQSAYTCKLGLSTKYYC